MRSTTTTSTTTTTTADNKLQFLSARFPSSQVQDVDQVVVMERLSNLIRTSDIFESNNVHFYTHMPSWIINDSRWSRHLRFLINATDDSNVGAGYQFWKPVLLLHHMQHSSVRDGDFVIYSDPTRMDAVVLEKIGLLTQIMVHRKSDLALDQHTKILERRQSKPDAYYYFSCRYRSFSDDDDDEEEDTNHDERATTTWQQLEPATDDSMQYDASFLMVRRNSRTIQFIQDWVEAAQQYKLISDEKSFGLTEAPDFEWQSFDQSLLSLLLKCKYGEPAKQLVASNSSLRDESRKTYTFTLRIDGVATTKAS